MIKVYKSLYNISIYKVNYLYNRSRYILYIRNYMTSYLQSEKMLCQKLNYYIDDDLTNTVSTPTVPRGKKSDITDKDRELLIYSLMM